MNKPSPGDKVTKEQVNLALNIADFPKSTPEKDWHEALFEPWSMKFGYPEGKAIYGSVRSDGGSFHVYFLNDGHQLPIILKNAQTPEDYGVKPKV